MNLVERKSKVGIFMYISKKHGGRDCVEETWKMEIIITKYINKKSTDNVSMLHQE